MAFNKSYELNLDARAIFLDLLFLWCTMAGDGEFKFLIQISTQTLLRCWFIALEYNKSQLYLVFWGRFLDLMM